MSTIQVYFNGNNVTTITEVGTYRLDYYSVINDDLVKIFSTYIFVIDEYQIEVDLFFEDKKRVTV